MVRVVMVLVLAALTAQGCSLPPKRPAPDAGDAVETQDRAGEQDGGDGAEGTVDEKDGRGDAETAEAQDAAEGEGDGADAADAVDGDIQTDAKDAADGVDAPDGGDATEAVEAAEVADAGDTAGIDAATETVDVGEVEDAGEAAAAPDAAETIELVEATDGTGPLDAADAVDADSAADVSDAAGDGDLPDAADDLSVPDLPEPDLPQPDCAGKECGDDGIGGTCGTCPGSQTCTGEFKCDFVFKNVAKGSWPHTVDGQFTGWKPVAPPPMFEWFDIAGVDGALVRMYFDYDGTMLHVLADGVGNKLSPLTSGCFLRFAATTEWETQRWQGRVYAGGAIRLVLNGQEVPPDGGGAAGAYAFTSTPFEPALHVVVEWKLPVGPGRFAFLFDVPGAGQSCDVMQAEPTLFVGQAMPGGGLKIAATSDVPWLVGANPAAARDGTVVALTGSALGGGAGGCAAGGVPAQVVSWQARTVEIVMPDGAGDGTVRCQTAGGEQTEELPLPLVQADEEPALVVGAKGIHAHKVDGKFTGWEPGGGWTGEWSETVPLVGEVSRLFADYSGKELHLLAEWPAGMGPPAGEGCARFVVVTQGGVQQWDVLMLANGEQFATLNGTAGAAAAEAVRTVTASPLDPTPHMVMEAALEAAPGAFGVKAYAEADGFGCELVLAAEPANVQGILEGVGGTLWAAPRQAGMLLSVVPFAAKPGELVAVHGSGLGAEQGDDELFLGLTAVAPTAWSDALVEAVVPAGAKGSWVYVVHPDLTWTNRLWLSIPMTDGDGDGVQDIIDNCLGLANAGQTDADQDGEGDACDPDMDDDGWVNGLDAFPKDGTEWRDWDVDGTGDSADNCLGLANPDQANLDQDALGDACDPDIDNDGVANGQDVFPLDPQEWADADQDGTGDNADCLPFDPLHAAPDCTGRECGDDGCGGSCGSCPEPVACTAQGLCDWQDCAKTVGCLDACEVQAETPEECAAGCKTVATQVAVEKAEMLRNCRAFLCAEVSEPDALKWCEVANCGPEYAACYGCLPSCAGLACGDDGCGGSCGGCVSGQVCVSHQCMFDYLLVGESGFAHTVDGQVTGWDPESLPPAWEWQYLPAAYGTLADYYLDYDGSKLHFLVDVSTTGEAPLAASCRLRLSFYAAWGLLQWVVELAVDGSLDAWVNGVPGDVPALGLSGAYGFAASPANALPHDLFEVSVAVPPGGFALMAAVPQAGVACEPAETDPVAVVGELLGDGGLLLATDSEVPWIVSAMPPGAMPGDAVEVKGVAFGAETGIAHVGGKEAAVSSWAPGAAMLLVPDAADSSGLRLTTAGGKETNVMPFTVLSPP